MNTAARTAPVAVARASAGRPLGKRAKSPNFDLGGISTAPTPFRALFNGKAARCTGNAFGAQPAILTPEVGNG
jgi:hypothetical protein